MARPSPAAKRRRRSLVRRIARLSRSGIALPLALLGGATVAFGLLVWLAERGRGSEQFSSVWDGLWWALVTIATVGYGDKYPVGAAGKIAASLLMLSGIVITAVVSGTAASLFVERRIREGKGLQDLRLKGHIVVCGWNAQADGVLDALEGEAEAVALVNALSPEAFEAIKARHPELDLSFVRGDHTQEAALRKAALDKASACIFVPDDTGPDGDAGADERTILSALAARAVAPELPLRAGIQKASSEQHLRRAGVDEVVLHGEFTGFLLAAPGAGAGLPSAARELLSASSPKRLRAEDFPASLVGKSFAEASAWFIANRRAVLAGVLSVEKAVSLDDILSNDSGAIDAFIKRKFEEAAIDIGEGQKPGSRSALAPDPSYLIGPSDRAFLIGGEA